MVCPAYLYFIKLELERLGLSYKTLIMSEVELSYDISEKVLRQLNLALFPYRLKLEFGERTKMVMKIKAVVSSYLDNPEIEAKLQLSTYLVKNVNRSYDYLNYIFQEKTGTSIEWYFHSRKIERAIELLIYYKLTLTEIAYQVNYSSEDELIYQFKSITGLMPERFKNLKGKPAKASVKVAA